ILMKTQFLILLCILKVNSSIAFSADDIDQLICSSIKEFNKLADYTCNLDKRVNKNSIIYNDPAILVKYKKPKHYYFRWKKGRFKGQEVIYVAGRNNDKIVAHSGGIFRFFTLRLDPDGSRAMKRNHHSLRESGMEKIMSIIEDNYNRSKKTGLGLIRYMGEDWIDGKNVWVINATFPDNHGFYAHKINIF
ncbi:DUF1571 domain-containing protein, partial [Thermodesulfobacteriota bacterium]